MNQEAVKWTLIGMACLVLAGLARYYGQTDVAAALFAAGAGALAKEHGRSSREPPEPEDLPRYQKHDQ